MLNAFHDRNASGKQRSQPRGPCGEEAHAISLQQRRPSTLPLFVKTDHSLFQQFLQFPSSVKYRVNVHFFTGNPVDDAIRLVMYLPEAGDVNTSKLGDAVFFQGRVKNQWSYLYIMCTALLHSVRARHGVPLQTVPALRDGISVYYPPASCFLNLPFLFC